jgi:hypothetical protein
VAETTVLVWDVMAFPTAARPEIRAEFVQGMVRHVPT